MFTGRPERLPHFDYRGFHRYSLTFCTFQRERVFVTQPVVDLVLTQFLRSAADSFGVVAYCFMPDHVHLLVAGTSEESDANQFIARAKQYSGFHFKQQRDRRLWQRYGFERVLRNDESTLVSARYIFENPVRAGLSKNLRDYPFLGSLTHPLEQILDAVQDDVPADFDIVKT